jgi:LuxR family maltose regulon positive regulatory protein
LSYKYFVDGDFNKAEQANLETIRLSKEIGFTLRQLHGTNKQALIYQFKGQLQRGYQLIQTTLSELQEQGLSGYFAAGAMHCRLADLLYEWDQLEQVDFEIKNHLKPERVAGVPYLQVDFLNVRARNLLVVQEFSSAQALLEQASALIQQTYIWPGLAWQTETLQVRLWLQKGDIALAAAWAAAQPGDGSDLPGFSSETREILRARILLATGKAEDAVHLLDRLEASAQNGSRNGSLVEIKILKALALDHTHQDGAAVTALAQAMALAEPEGYIRTFIEAGDPIADLLAQTAHANRSTHSSYAHRLLAKLENKKETARPFVAQAEAGPSAWVEPLSKREIEVLQCMADGLTNHETARRLVIEISTVKRHINNIFSKLGAINRVQALNKAREYKII